MAESMPPAVPDGQTNPAATLQRAIVPREELVEAVRDLILANFTNGRYGYRLNPTKAAEDVLNFLAPIIERREAEAWDAGLVAGIPARWYRQGEGRYTSPDCPPNPYRDRMGGEE